MHIYDYIHRRCPVVILAAAMLSASPVCGQVDLGLTPMRVEFSATPGRPYSGALTLSNAGSEKARIRTELLDFYVDKNTTPQFFANVPSEADFSCRSWLSVNPMELEIGPHSQVSIRYTVRTPATASERSYYCAIGFLTLPTAAETSGIAVRAAVRVVGVIYATVGKPVAAGEIKELKLEQAPNATETLWRGVVVMENSGFLLYRPAGTLDVLDSTGRLIESQKLISYPVLPQRQQRYVMPLRSSLPPGQYTLRARVDVGSEIQEASTVVTAEPSQPVGPKIGQE